MSRRAGHGWVLYPGEPVRHGGRPGLRLWRTPSAGSKHRRDGRRRYRLTPAWNSLSVCRRYGLWYGRRGPLGLTSHRAGDGAAAEFGSRVWRWRLEMNGAWILGLLSFDLAPGNRFWRAGIDLAGGAAKIWRGKVERRTAEHRIGRRKSNAGNRLGASASFSGGAIQPGV